jgi:hypothetical protein
MDQLDREAEPFFTQPVRQISLMLICLALVAFGAYVAYPRVSGVFLANPIFNAFIIFVFVIGVLACFWQVIQLRSSVSWIEGFASGRPGHAMITAPRLLAPLASLLRSRGARMQISSSSARSILDSVATRIDEARDITRYIINLLIFLGLLGTFFGLAITVPALVETIQSLAPREGEGAVEIFSRLMSGLEKQLGGMGVAFGSSLLGLAGSLVVGLLELFAGHGQNRFYRELEEWLSTITRLGFSSSDGDGPADASADTGAATALLQHFAGQMEALQSLFSQSDAARAVVDERLGTLAESVDGLVANLRESREDAANADTAAAAESTKALNRVAEGVDGLMASLRESREEAAKSEQAAAAEGASALNRVAEGVDGLMASLRESREDAANADTAAAAESTSALNRVAEGVDGLATSLREGREDAARSEAAAASENSRALARAAEGQERLIAALEAKGDETGAHVDAESRMRLRSIDVQLLRILEEMSAGRQESLADLRTDLAALNKAIRTMRRDATGATGRRS